RTNATTKTRRHEKIECLLRVFVFSSFDKLRTTLSNVEGSWLRFQVRLWKSQLRTPASPSPSFGRLREALGRTARTSARRPCSSCGTQRTARWRWQTWARPARHL